MTERTPTFLLHRSQKCGVRDDTVKRHAGTDASGNSDADYYHDKCNEADIRRHHELESIAHDLEKIIRRLGKVAEP